MKNSSRSKGTGLLKTWKGQPHRWRMRASMYNAMPIEGVEKLVEFMKKFEMEISKIQKGRGTRPFSYI